MPEDAPTALLPRVGSWPPQWPTVDPDLPETVTDPRLALLERVLDGLRAL